jgi:Mn-containing catalase
MPEAIEVGSRGGRGHPLVAIAGGGGVNLFNSMGNAWTADYLKITGELDVDLRSNIAAEARAKIVYERLINFCRDAGTKDALQFLMTREITHMRAFTLALESMGKPPFSIGKIAPTPKLVDQFFNDSTGEGDHGEIDARGPWNEGSPGNSWIAALQDLNGVDAEGLIR